MNYLKTAIDFCLNNLSIDRSAIFKIDIENLKMYGTWGTDNQGKMYNDHSYQQNIDKDDWLYEMIIQGQTLRFHQGINLQTSGKQEQTGWQLVAILWLDGQAKAWLSCDNLIKKRELLPSQKEVITVFCASLAQWYQSILHQEQLRAMSESLKIRVENKTKDLKNSLLLLSETQGQLLSFEKITLLSKFTSGLAHEINNPNSFVMSNLDYLKKQSDLIEGIHIKDQDPSVQASYALLKEDWPELIQDSMKGSIRIQKIISALSPLNHCLDIHNHPVLLLDNIKECFKPFSEKLTLNLQLKAT